MKPLKDEEKRLRQELGMLLHVGDYIDFVVPDGQTYRVKLYLEQEAIFEDPETIQKRIGNPFFLKVVTIAAGKIKKLYKRNHKWMDFVVGFNDSEIIRLKAVKPKKAKGG